VVGLNELPAFGVPHERLACRVCAKRATRFSLLATETDIPVQNSLGHVNENYKVIGFVIGLFCDDHGPRKGGRID